MLQAWKQSLLLSLAFMPFLLSSDRLSAQVRNPPYVPSADAIVTEKLKLAEVKSSDIVYDLGSGDGRIVIAAVQQFGAQRGVGVEFNPELVEKSNANAQKANVSDRVKFIQRDLFDTDIREATVVTLYLFPEINLKLRPKLLAELKPGTRIVSQAFNMGDWKPDRTVLASRGDSKATLFLWIVPAQLSGTWQGKITSETRRSSPIAINLKQQFQQATAEIQLETQTITLPNVKIIGDQVRFENRITLQGQPTTLRFEGQAGNRTLTGTLTMQGRGLNRDRYQVTLTN